MRTQGNIFRFAYLALILAGLFSISAVVYQARDIEKGANLYQQYCASCHGDNLQGGNAQSLVNGIWQYGAENSYIFRNIKYGITHLGMPAYENSLSDSDINDILAYIRAAEKELGVVRPAIASETGTMDYDLNVEIFAEGLEVPWAIDFIDRNTALITEKPGRVRVVRNGKMVPSPVEGIPAVLNEGQGGLLDVAIDPDYAENGWIYLAYSHALPVSEGQRPAAMTRIVRGKLSGNKWTDEQVIWEAPTETYRTTRHHYGCRIVFDPWGRLFFAIGDRGIQDQAQDVTLPSGKVHRIFPDGSIPDDNPYLVVPGAMASLYSLGNRNIQGMAIHPVTGQLWTTEHGPMGGDELNLILPGRNYGWPVITYGLNYNGTIVSEHTHYPAMEQPNFMWNPSPGLCGLDFYTGDMFPKWNNKLLVGALKYEDITLVTLHDDRVIHTETILKNAGRVRDVQTGPDGAIYVVLNKPDVVVRLSAK
jgi:glucose/arabinose dehydrogenase